MIQRENITADMRIKNYQNIKKMASDFCNLGYRFLAVFYV
ncbi:hypothetical protein DHBDCA_p1111 [Dehalobacter sp. DCA]|nr:hypothetical protein DHBDCA_p1111 [Dehalobacter sp. DCA]